MKFSTQLDLFKHYKKRFSYFEYQLLRGFSSESTKAIVIPCYNEPNLLDTLNALTNCLAVTTIFEVIIVVNEALDSEKRVRDQNRETIQSFEKWEKENVQPFLKFHLINARNLPPKKAGVGLARKIGMDEAFRQFALQGKVGHIICLDADCTVSTDYLDNAKKSITNQIKGGHFQFEHKYEEEENSILQNGIIQYELHLRYHNQGLKLAGLPYAAHTVGSCMVVRSDMYGLIGGMNQRKAGEDFYFMNKLYPHGDCITIPKVKVYPSCRISDRVPFGTGRAQGEWLKSDSQVFYTYNPRIYEILKIFSSALVQKKCTLLPQELSAFINEQNVIQRVESIEKRSKNKQSYLKNVFSVFDAFFYLKAIHFLRDKYFENIALETAARQLLGVMDYGVNAKSELELLNIFRQIEAV